MTRIISALVLVVFLALPVIFGPTWVFFIAVLLILPLCIFELMRACLSQGARLLGWVVFYGSFPFLWFTWRGQLWAAYATLSMLTLAIITLGLILFERRQASGREVALALSGLMYPLVLMSFWLNLRMGIDGRFWMIFGLVCTFLSDIGAYYVGKNFGRRRLAQRLSPKKTWEGFFGGCAAAVLAGIIFSRVYPLFDPLSGTYTLWMIGLLSLCVAVLDLIGDLSASMFKREFNIKDLGSLIPGHGGMLDRMDGIVPVGAALYIIIRVLT